MGYCVRKDPDDCEMPTRSVIKATVNNPYT